MTILRVQLFFTPINLNKRLTSAHKLFLERGGKTGCAREKITNNDSAASLNLFKKRHNAILFVLLCSVSRMRACRGDQNCLPNEVLASCLRGSLPTVATEPTNPVATASSRGRGDGIRRPVKAKTEVAFFGGGGKVGESRREAQQVVE